MKRLVITIAVILVLAGVVAAGFYLSRQGGEESPAGQGPSAGGTQQLPRLPAPAGAVTATTTLAAARQDGFGVVVPTQTKAFFVESPSSVAVIQPDGQIFRITQSKTDVLSETVFEEIIEASFSFDGKRALVGYGGHAAPQYTVFDLAAKSWRPLPTGIRGAAWAPADSRIAYLIPGSETDALATLDMANDRSQPQTLARLSVEDVSLHWPNPRHLVLMERSSVYYPSSVWDYDLTARTLVPLIDSEYGAKALWDFDMANGLFFRGERNRRGGILSLVDGTGAMRRQFNLVTLPSKCAFYKESVPAPSVSTSTRATSTRAATSTSSSATFAACALPRDPKFAASALPDSYDKRALYTEDDFYSVDLATGDLTPILLDSSVSLDAEKMRVSGERLYFINRLDEKVYGVDLKR